MVYVFLLHLFVVGFCKRQYLSFFSSSWCQGLTAACDCGTPWTFQLTFSHFLKDATDSAFFVGSTCVENVIE